MLKKVITTTVFLVLIGLLIVGAVNRTLARSALTADNHLEGTHTEQVNGEHGAIGHIESEEAVTDSVGHGNGVEKLNGWSSGGAQGLGGQESNAQERSWGNQSATSGTAISWQIVTGEVVESNLEAMILVERMAPKCSSMVNPGLLHRARTSTHRLATPLR